jgi:hypothetical protein
MDLQNGVIARDGLEGDIAVPVIGSEPGPVAIAIFAPALIIDDGDL